MIENPAILLAEDDPNDVLFVQIALKRARSDIKLAVVSNGLEVVKYLKGQQPYAERSLFPFPNFLLLDLRLPIMTGFQVLRWINEQHALKGFPVIVLTDSLQKRDSQIAYEMGASYYLVKPCGLEQLTKLMIHVTDRWLDVWKEQGAQSVGGWGSDAEREAA